MPSGLLPCRDEGFQSQQLEITQGDVLPGTIGLDKYLNQEIEKAILENR